MRGALWRSWPWLAFSVLLCAVMPGHAQTHYVYADVVGVDSLATPYQPCSSHPPAHRRTNPVAALVGGMVGGLLGNQIGGGTGKTIFTVAGAAAGAALAGRPRRVERSHCRKNNAAHEYQVWYRYHGQEFSKRMADYPGERILVAVDVAPLTDQDFSAGNGAYP